LVDVPDLGSGALRRGGSSPFARTTKITALLTLKKDKQAVFINLKQQVLDPKPFRRSSSELISNNFKLKI
jgi:hypothetical protein